MGILLLNDKQVGVIDIEDMPPMGIVREIDENGKLIRPSKINVFINESTLNDSDYYVAYSPAGNSSSIIGLFAPNLTEIIGNSALNSVCVNCADLKTISFPELTTITGDLSLHESFKNCTSLVDVNFPKLHTASGYRCFRYAFQNCQSLITISFPSLTDLSNSSGQNEFYYAFSNCTNLESVDFSSLKVITDFRTAFENCTNLTSVNFSNVEFILNKGLLNAFVGCSSLQTLSFPSLNWNKYSYSYPQSGSNTPFYTMFRSKSGCTVHFPSNLETDMANSNDVVTGFGGSNITVLFDLPATN